MHFWKMTAARSKAQRGKSWKKGEIALSTLFLQVLRKKATVRQVTTMLAVSKNVLFPGPNHLQTTGADEPSL